MHADIGSVRLVGMSPISKRAGTRDMMVYHSEAEEELRYIEENLQRLTVGILDVSTDDLPRRYQSQTAGVLGRFAKLLCRVAQVVMCYHEDHHDD